MRWRLRVVLAVLLLLALGLALLAPIAWARYQLRAAEQALQRHDLHAAWSDLEPSLGKWSTPTRLQLLAAQTARRLDDGATAERLLTDLERRQQATTEVALEWLLLGVQQGDLGGHVTHLQSLVDAEHPASALILEALGKGFLNVARASDALVCLNLLLRRDPDHALALRLRARAWEGLHDPDRALADYARAVGLVPSAIEARLGLAECLQRLGRHREAIGHYESARAQQPDNAAVLLGLARCRFDQHELHEAEELLDRLLARQPEHVSALLERGRLALCQGETSQAIALLMRAGTIAPWQREAQGLLYRCLQAQGERSQAEVCQARLRALEAREIERGQLSLRFRQSPRDPAVRFEVANWALNNGQEVEGVRWLFATLDVGPTFVPAHAAVADYFERQGQPRRAAEHRRLSTAANLHAAAP